MDELTMAGAFFGGSMIRWIALLPLVAALVHGVLIGLVRARISDRLVFSVSVSAILAALSLSMIGLYDLVGVGGAARLLDSVGPWIGGGVGPRSFSAELAFQLDPLSAVFCLAVTGTALVVYLHAIGGFTSGAVDVETAHRTFAMLDLLVGSTLVLVLADNLLLFFLGWAGVGIASQLFASFDFEDADASRAGASTFVVGRVGDLGLLAAMLLLFDGLSRAGAPALTFRGIEAAFRLLEGQGVLWLSFGAAQAPLLLEIVGFGLVLAALTKCAQLPLHFWLPQSTGGPAAAQALLQSVTTVVAGVYVLLRFAFLLESAPGALRTLILAGSATALLASLAAANQRDLPRLLAFTTSALLGFAVLAIGVGAHSTAAFLMLTHAASKSLLLLVAGVVIDAQRGETDLRRMGGLGRRLSGTHWLFLIGGLGLVGLAPAANFFPIEELVAFLWISARPESGFVLGVVVTSVGVLAFAVGRAYFLIFWGSVRPSGLVASPLRDPTGWQQNSLTILAVLAAIGGLLSPSQFWQTVINAQTEQMDTVGFFLTRVVPGSPDPELGGSERGWLAALVVFCVVLGLAFSAARYARAGYRGESERASIVLVTRWMREMFYIERAYQILLVRPIRRLSERALARGIESQLIDRFVVSGGSGLVRGAIWGVLRRVQNGRTQSYTLIGLLTVLVVVTWMVV
ncbi:MAG: proton-conducting transporter membrane subunit [Myxococcota bacterium]